MNVAAARRGTSAEPACGGALILGADYRALGAVRSLGRRGVPVWVVAEQGEPLATLSRYARRTLRWPGPDDGVRAAFLCDLAARQGLGGWLLIPSSDRALGFVGRAYDELGGWYTHSTPEWDVVRWPYDKRLTYALAQRIGVAYPWTLPAVASANGHASEVRFPAALKPAIKERHNSLTAAKAWRVDDQEQLRRRYADACALVEPELLLVQELIGGGGQTQLSYAALCRNGEPLAWLTARRTRQYPRDFGRASTFVETIDCPDIVEPSERLLQSIGYTGLIEIEYKRDPRDGVVRLLDMNPRLWGWHALCARAGVDFPWLLWRMVNGQSVPGCRARTGVRWLRLSTDTPTAVKEVFAHRLSVQSYADSLAQRRKAAIFTWDDPLPGLADVPVVAYTLARRLLSGEAA